MGFQSSPRPRQKKLRNLPRRLRALRRWAESFEGRFPSARDLGENPRYWNWKIPVDWAVLQGRYASAESRREAAQCLIDACAALLRAKPEWAAGYRVTCVVCDPDVFGSELCIYLDEDYFRDSVEAKRDEDGERTLIQGRSLAAEWRLVLPPGVDELGVRVESAGSEQDRYVGDHWRYGEVLLDRADS